MTQEDKELLLKDLCARLPYEVKAYDTKSHINNSYMNLCHVNGIVGEVFISSGMQCRNAPIEEIKPYLFPLSSMTEEQREELFIAVLDEQVSISDCSFNDATGYSEILTNYIIDAIDWLNKNHFDYRGLIPKGLALDATGLNIY